MNDPYPPANVPASQQAGMDTAERVVRDLFAMAQADMSVTVPAPQLQIVEIAAHASRVVVRTRSAVAESVPTVGVFMVGQDQVQQHHRVPDPDPARTLADLLQTDSF